jgi:ribonuclease P protein component
MPAPARTDRPQLSRLKRRVDFEKAAAARRRWVMPGLILQVRRHDPGEDFHPCDSSIRVGFTVSRKVGNAVERNRVRRRLRAVAEQTLPAFAACGHDFVVIGRQATIGRPYDALVSDLEAALKGLGVHREKDRS